MGRYVNDSKYGNSQMRIVKVDSAPRLCLFASKDILMYDEIRYNYGVSNLPWRTLAIQDGSVTVYM